MKRSKRLHILLGVLAAVGIVTFAVTQYEEKQEEIEASGEVVLEIDPAAVQTLSWEYDAVHGFTTRMKPSRLTKKGSTSCWAYLKRSARRSSSRMSRITASMGWMTRSAR